MKHNNHTIVGHCKTCGRPVYMPIYWMGDHDSIVREDREGNFVRIKKKLLGIKMFSRPTYPTCLHLKQEGPNELREARR